MKIKLETKIIILNWVVVFGVDILAYLLLSSFSFCFENCPVIHWKLLIGIILINIVIFAIRELVDYERTKTL